MAIVSPTPPTTSTVHRRLFETEEKQEKLRPRLGRCLPCITQLALSRSALRLAIDLLAHLANEALWTYSYNILSSSALSDQTYHTYHPVSDRQFSAQSHLTT